MHPLRDIRGRQHEPPAAQQSDTDYHGDRSKPEENADVMHKQPSAASQRQKMTSPVANGPASAWSLAAIFMGLFFALTCIGLDRSIVATAIPQITADFNSLPDVGWYGSAFLLTTCCFQLLLGKLYAELDIKRVFLVSLLLFEVGSVVCAVAPNSGALIAGRAVQGVGAAGVLAGAFIIVAHTIPMDRRPKYTGALGGAVGTAQIVAPTLGGVLTDRLSWRWCFWINLPFGAVTAIVVIFLVHLPANPNAARSTPREFLFKFDVLGTILLIPWIVSLLLALQWGGTLHPWSSWRIILLLIIFAVFFIAWCASQVYQGDRATVPLRILKRRTMISAVWYMFLNFACFFLIIYYVPIWFQAARGESAYWSGINFLTTSAASAVLVIASGYLTTLSGYFVPQMIAGTTLTSVGCGMLYTFDRETSDAFWIATLILIGAGIGLGIQQPVVAVQTVFTGADSALATSALIFSQSMSSTIFLCVGQNVFTNALVSNVRRLAPEVQDPHIVVDVGAADVHDVFAKEHPESLNGVLEAYDGALRKVFMVSLVLSCLTVFGCVGIEWVSVKKHKAGEADNEARCSSQIVNETKGRDGVGGG